MKKFLLLLMGALSHLVFAQPTFRLVQAIVQTAETTSTGVWKLSLQRPDDFKLEDSVGFVVGLYSSSSFRNRDLSDVTVEETSGNTITASAKTINDIKPGDVVFLKQVLPGKLPFGGKLFNAAVQGIFVNAPSGESYYSWNQIVSGTKSWEDQVIAKMLADVKSTSSGALATTSAIQTFLTALARVPQVYAGRPLNFTEEFLGWVESGSTDYSIIDRFTKALGKDSDFENLKKTNRQTITRECLLNLTNASNVLHSAGGALNDFVNTMKVISRLSADVLSGEDLGKVHFFYGVALSIAEKYQESLEQYTLAATAYQNNNEVQYARSVSRQADCIKNLTDYEKSIEFYYQASGLWRQAIKKNPNHFNYYNLGNAFWNIAWAYGKLNKIFLSNQNYEKAFQVFDSIRSVTDAVTMLFNQAANFRELKDYENEIKLYQRAVAYAKADLNAEGEGEALDQITRMYSVQGKNDKALETYHRMDTLYTALGLTKKLAPVKWEIARLNSLLGKYSEAITIYETAYTLYLEVGDTANASVILSNMGAVYWGMSDVDKAIESHIKAIDMATKINFTSQAALSWRRLSDLYKETKNLTKQTEALNNANLMSEALKDTTELVKAYFEIGRSFGNSQETAKAEEYYNKALTLAQAKNDSSNMAWAYYWFGDLYRRIKPNEAVENYGKAIVLQRKLKDKSSLLHSLADQASITMTESVLNEALALAQELNDDKMIAYVSESLSEFYRLAGKTDLAHQRMDSSIQLYKKLKNRTFLVGIYITYSDKYLYDYGDFNKAQKLLNDAKLLLDSIDDPITVAQFHTAQSKFYKDQGQYNLAVAELDKARDISKSMKVELTLAHIYNAYGNIYKAQSKYELALKYQTMADSMFQALNLETPRLFSLASIGNIFFEQGDYTKAIESFKRSIQIMEDRAIQNTDMCKMLSGIGLTYSSMTNYEEAEKWLLKALETSKLIKATRTEAGILNDLGKLKIETKKYAEAEKFLLEAKSFLIEQNLMIERSTNATLLGHLYLKKGELEKAKAELTEAIVLAEKFGKDATLWEGYFRIGDYYRQSKNLKESKNYLLKSVGVIDKLRNNVVGGEEAQKLFSSNKWLLEVYEELISVLLELGEIEEAMGWLQKVNENNFRDKIRSLDVNFEDEAKNKMLAQEKEMKLKLDVIEKQIVAQKQAKYSDAGQIKTLEATRNIAEGDYLKFVNQTVNVQPELSKYFSNTVQPSQLKGKKKLIPKDMALVSYLVGEKQLYIFVATSDTVVARIVSVTKEKIHRDVNAMTNISKSHLGNFGTIDLTTQEAERKEVAKEVKQTDQMLKPFEEAYNYLISPISEFISGKGRLGIIPTGELNYIPFQLLGKTLKSNKFSMLINQFAMFYANSTDMLTRTVTGEKTLNILAFGNPDNTLPSTEREVNDIKKIFPSAQVYVQTEATEDKAKYASEEFNVMHFATHGNLDFEDFTKSYLTMASNKSKNEDGLLTLGELWGMEVMSNLDMVVLSACQTAVTKGSNESSPVSPASGFLQNGVKSVVATLWKVDDEATSILMNDFYKNIKTMDAVDAIRSAQSNLSNNPKFTHPFYWAAMVLIGDWR